MEERLKALELLVFNQQTRIDYLEKQNKLYTKDIETFLNEQITLAQSQRGSRGTDMITLMKYVSTTIAGSVTKLQQEVTDILDSYIQKNHQVIVELPKHQNQGQGHNQNNEEITNMKESILHLEKQLVVEVSKMQTTKQTDFSPLTKLQATVDQLVRDIQNLKKLDSKAFIDSCITTASSNLRKEFISQTEVKASKESVIKCKEDIRRLEKLIYKTPIEESPTFYQEYENSSKESFCAWFEQEKQNLEEFTKRKEKELQHSLNVSLETIQKVNRQLPESVLDKYVLKFTALRDELYTIVQGNETLFSETMEEINRKLTSESKQLSELQLSQMRLQKYLEKNPIVQPEPQKEIVKKPQESINTYSILTKCFYTALFGKNTDTLGIFEPIPGWDYICFTDSDIESPVWKCIKIDPVFQKPVLNAKYVKWMSHEFVGDYDVAVWLDGYISPNPLYNNLFESWITDMYRNNIQIGHRKHAERNCIWDECDAVLKSKRDTKDHVDSVRSRLRSAKMPKGWGLFDTNIVIKFQKSKEVEDLGKEIFALLEKDSYRDQLAIPYVYYLNNYNNFKEYSLLEACLKTGIHVRNISG